MAIKSLFVKNMLANYDRQLLNARRLARYRRVMNGGEDHVALSRDARRKQMVQRVAREIIENLIITGADNPLVSEIKNQLEEETGENLRFAYPLVDQDLQIFRVTDEGPTEVSPNERMSLLQRLWEITLDKVDETML